jgi:hypothetical protein
MTKYVMIDLGWTSITSKENLMSIERKGGTTFKGNALTLVGEAIKVGQKAPNLRPWPAI